MQGSAFGERTDRKIFKEVFVHLDFKGAPPTFQFLKNFIMHIGTKYEKVVTGLLMEFEDTFPYDGNLKPLRGINYYSRNEIEEVISLMEKYKLKMVPLVQTFGHLEFVLKRDRFSHLRESKDNYTSLCPLNPESIELLCSMIDQHMEILGYADGKVPFIHIGADEVFNLASCKACKFFSEEASSHALYANYIQKICKHLQKNYPDT